MASSSPATRKLEKLSYRAVIRTAFPSIRGRRSGPLGAGLPADRSPPLATRQRGHRLGKLSTDGASGRRGTGTVYVVRRTGAGTDDGAATSGASPTHTDQS